MLTGNQTTAEQWAQVIDDAGHDVLIDDGSPSQKHPDVVVALHADKSHDRVRELRAAHPAAVLVVALTGTDLYPALSTRSLQTLRWAHRIVGLQRFARDRVPLECQPRVRVIVQAAVVPATNAGPNTESFEIVTVGNLRAVKDPMRPAWAARLLPVASRVQITHVGAILDPEYTDLVATEQAENARYVWVGAKPFDAAAEILARSRLSVVSSFHEGGGRVIGESIALGTPVLAARNDASRALLGDDYPGLFTAGATEELAALITRAENEPAFLDELAAWTRRAAPQFSVERERAGWRDLLAECEELRARGVCAERCVGGDDDAC